MVDLERVARRCTTQTQGIAAVAAGAHLTRASSCCAASSCCCASSPLPRAASSWAASSASRRLHTHAMGKRGVKCEPLGRNARCKTQPSPPRACSSRDRQPQMLQR
jgi:hypothetical protein